MYVCMYLCMYVCMYCWDFPSLSSQAGDAVLPFATLSWGAVEFLPVVGSVCNLCRFLLFLAQRATQLFVLLVLI